MGANLISDKLRNQQHNYNEDTLPANYIWNDLHLYSEELYDLHASDFF